MRNIVKRGIGGVFIGIVILVALAGCCLLVIPGVTDTLVETCHLYEREILAVLGIGLLAAVIFVIARPYPRKPTV